MKLQDLLSSEEQIIWEGTPDVPIFSLQNVFTHYLPGVVFIFLFIQYVSGVEIHPLLTTLNTYINAVDFLQIFLIIFGIGLLCYPFVYSCYTKHIVYVFTNTRAFSFNSKTNEIEFEVAAKDILGLTKSVHSDGRISLHFWQRCKSNHPDCHFFFSRSGFEYIPSHILDYYMQQDYFEGAT